MSAKLKSTTVLLKLHSYVYSTIYTRATVLYRLSYIVCSVDVRTTRQIQKQHYNIHRLESTHNLPPSYHRYVPTVCMYTYTCTVIVQYRTGIWSRTHIPTRYVHTCITNIPTYAHVRSLPNCRWQCADHFLSSRRVTLFCVSALEADWSFFLWVAAKFRSLSFTACTTRLERNLLLGLPLLLANLQNTYTNINK